VTNKVEFSCGYNSKKFAFRCAESKYGAYTIAVFLNDEEIKLSRLWPIAFTLPKLKCRSVIPDEGYRFVMKEAGEFELAGLFKEGQWFGHSYSNGVIDEEKNPTPIGEVEGALRQSIDEILNRLRDSLM